jgi:hypothetical protein
MGTNLPRKRVLEGQAYAYALRPFSIFYVPSSESELRSNRGQTEWDREI